MTKMIWLTSLSIFFVIFVVPALLAATLKIIPNGDQPGYDGSKKLSIYGNRHVVQKFIAQEKNLTAIGTSIKNPNLNNKKDIIFDLYDQVGNAIREVHLSGKNIQDGDFIKITFDPILDSTGKTYTFSLSSPESGSDDDIEVFIIDSPTNSIISYTYDKETRLGGLPMVTFYKSDSKWQVIKRIYLDLFSRILNINLR